MTTSATIVSRVSPADRVAFVLDRLGIGVVGGVIFMLTV